MKRVLSKSNSPSRTGGREDKDEVAPGKKSKKKDAEPEKIEKENDEEPADRKGKKEELEAKLQKAWARGALF